MFFFSMLISSFHFGFQILVLLENSNLKKKIKRLELQQENKWEQTEQRSIKKWISYIEDIPSMFFCLCLIAQEKEDIQQYWKVANSKLKEENIFLNYAHKTLLSPFFQNAFWKRYKIEHNNF